VKDQTAEARWHRVDSRFLMFVRNLGTRYTAVAIQAAVGLIVLPINLQYLGPSAYGLWMLTASLTTYFSAMDLGFGGAVVRFVAEYRARRDPRALNETLSTMFYVYSGIGLLAYIIAIGVSFALGHIFALTPEQAATGQIVLLIVAVNIALHFVFSVYGGVINGFQSYYLNNVVATASTILAAVVNVIVVMSGYGLIELVAATTACRVAPYILYVRNAHKVFPQLDIRWTHFNRSRLRQLTGFSIYLAVIDWSTRLNYTVDTVLIGAFLSTGAVAIYVVAQRLAQAMLRVTQQLHVMLLPVVVDRAIKGTQDEQQLLMIRATRFQLATAVAVAGAVAADADRLILAWVGPGYDTSAVLLQLLSYVVALRAWNGMPSTVLKGLGGHRWLSGVSAVCAVANLLLSIVLVNAMGIVGVALGTVIPVTVVNAFVVFPRACRRLGMSPWRGYRQVLAPAAWPAVLVVVVMLQTRLLIPARLLPVMLHVGAGVLAYVALFVRWGLDRDERRWLTTKLGELWRRRAQVLAAA
jgi:O-antigen/teichoic acid export membrane protein